MDSAKVLEQTTLPPLLASAILDDLHRRPRSILPAILGFFKRILSYNDNIEHELAIAENLAPVLLSTLIGRPSRVLIKDLQNQIHQNRSSIIISYPGMVLAAKRKGSIYYRTFAANVAAAVLNQRTLKNHDEVRR
jgi:hypothetical protein